MEKTVLQKVDYDHGLRPDGVWKASQDVLVAGKKDDGKGGK